jgi:hypothetical protein
MKGILGFAGLGLTCRLIDIEVLQIPLTRTRFFEL